MMPGAGPRRERNHLLPSRVWVVLTIVALRRVTVAPPSVEVSAHATPEPVQRPAVRAAHYPGTAQARTAALHQLPLRSHPVRTVHGGSGAGLGGRRSRRRQGRGAIEPAGRSPDRG